MPPLNVCPPAYGEEYVVGELYTPPVRIYRDPITPEDRLRELHDQVRAITSQNHEDRVVQEIRNTLRNWHGTIVAPPAMEITPPDEGPLPDKYAFEFELGK